MMSEVAERLTRMEPENAAWWISWAYSLRMMKSIQRAKKILQDALELHPRVARIHFDLACYECVEGNINIARHCLGVACKMDPALRADALDDPDLDQFWESF